MRREGVRGGSSQAWARLDLAPCPVSSHVCCVVDCGVWVLVVLCQYNKGLFVKEQSSNQHNTTPPEPYTTVPTTNPRIDAPVRTVCVHAGGKVDG